MSPAEKMDEIVRELEGLVHHEHVTGAMRALTVARELRDNAVEVRAEVVELDDTACSCAKARSYEVHHACGHVYEIGDHALLILSEPTPSREEKCNR